MELGQCAYLYCFLSALRFAANERFQEKMRKNDKFWNSFQQNFVKKNEKFGIFCEQTKFENFCKTIFLFSQETLACARKSSSKMSLYYKCLFSQKKKVFFTCLLMLIFSKHVLNAERSVSLTKNKAALRANIFREDKHQQVWSKYFTGRQMGMNRKQYGYMQCSELIAGWRLYWCVLHFPSIEQM